MLNKLILTAAVIAAALLLTPSKVDAYGACHVGYTHVGPNGVYHEGATAAGGYGGAYHAGYGGAYYHTGSSSTATMYSNAYRGYGGTAYGGARYTTGYGGAAAGGAYYGYVR
jgi:hypothetical protein